MPPSEAVDEFFEAVRAAEEEAEYTLSPGGPPGTPILSASRRQVYGNPRLRCCATLLSAAALLWTSLTAPFLGLRGAVPRYMLWSSTRLCERRYDAPDRGPDVGGHDLGNGAEQPQRAVG
jgi:hypothetical protein